MQELASAYYRENDFLHAFEMFRKAAAAARKAGNREAEDEFLVRS